MLRQAGATTLYINQNNAEDRRFQVGDPGRYLAPGLFQEMLATIKAGNIDPTFGFCIELEDDNGRRHMITGIRSSAIGVHHFDEGTRDLGTFLTETGYLAIAPIALCVEPDMCEQCQWIGIEESFAVVAGRGMLMASGDTMHVSLSAPISANHTDAHSSASTNKWLRAA